jgi:hypothetical protein
MPGSHQFVGSYSGGFWGWDGKIVTKALNGIAVCLPVMTMAVLAAFANVQGNSKQPLAE